MKYGYLRIQRGNAYCDFTISGFYHDGDRGELLHYRSYLGYSVRDAIRLFKRLYGLPHKHNITIYDERKNNQEV